MVLFTRCASKSILKQGFERVQFRIKLERPCLYLCHIEQVCDEVGHTITLYDYLTQAVLLPMHIHFAIGFFKQTRGKALNGGQRSTKFMGDDSQQVSLDSLSLVLFSNILEYPYLSDKDTFGISHVEKTHANVAPGRDKLPP